MKNNCINSGDIDPLQGGTNLNELLDLELEYLLDDECEQIVMSNELFNAFDRSSKRRKKYNRKKIYGLFKYLVYLYNDTINDTDKFGALTYLEKSSKLLDFLDIENIIELSTDQLNILLDLDDGPSIIRTYKRIQNKRHELTETEFELFSEMLKNTKSNEIDTKQAKKVYDYISSIYNANPILQDNVRYIKYLETFSKMNMQSIMTMRMYQIIDVFKIQNINYENINEKKKLINDLANFGYDTI